VGVRSPRRSSPSRVRWIQSFMVSVRKGRQDPGSASKSIGGRRASHTCPADIWQGRRLWDLLVNRDGRVREGERHPGRISGRPAPIPQSGAASARLPARRAAGTGLPPPAPG